MNKLQQNGPTPLFSGVRCKGGQTRNKAGLLAAVSNLSVLHCFDTVVQETRKASSIKKAVPLYPPPQKKNSILEQMQQKQGIVGTGYW